MTVSAVITIPATEFALGQVLENTGVRIELPQFVQIADSLVPYLWVSEPYDEAEFKRRVEADARVESLDVVDDLTEKTLYRIVWDHGINDLLNLLITHEVWVEQANTIERGDEVDDRAPATEEIGHGADVWRFQLRAPSREALAALYEGCREYGMNPQVQQIITNPAGIAGGQGMLTDKQHEALLAAYDGGYFDVPRDASLTDLAEELGISRQAFTRRLMRGIESVLTHTVVVEHQFIEKGGDR